ncbi:hypothetical protein [Krasilnikovia sp. MM14-A1004]|uniref:hypothetical protein n=1 Tax=Krasilnikovia sp. MM14-A1004 TaxID=3373541 RepID=UPI00399D051C
MEAHHDLRKFITETTVAQSRRVLSSGRAALCDGGDPDSATKHHSAVVRMRSVSIHRGADRHIDNVGRLTPPVWIESPTAMDSDQTAAEALQEAGTEVGVEVMVDRRTEATVAVAGLVYRSADPTTDLGLTA